MKLKFTSLLLFIIINVTAKDPSSALLLQSGTVYPENNIAEFIATSVDGNEIVAGYYFRIIQLSEYPDSNLQQEIKAGGIILNDYLPYRCYNAAIPVTFDRTKASSLKITSVLMWQPSYKLSRNINGQDIPAYCIREKGKADLIVHCQRNIPFEVCWSLLTANGCTILDSNRASASFTIRVTVDQIDMLTALPVIYFVEPISKPSVKDDTEGRTLHRSNMINTDLATGRHYDGNGVIIGLADDGEIGPHIDFTGRVIQHLTGAGGTHGDMTSGICVGAGNLIPRIRGMATGATLHVFDITSYPQINDAVNNYTNYGIVITSTSYAQTCNVYNGDSQHGDQLIHDNPQFSFCFSAGNEGMTDCSYGAGNLWGNITGGFKMGKNVIAVGNLRNTDELENSSSRGPAVDGRIKPDICSNGYNQRSTDEENTYQVGGGTSAACPGVAGCLAQLYQAYKEINNVSEVPSGLMKACILNTAEDLGLPGPDFKFGWGRINAFRALRTIEQHHYFSDSASQNQLKSQVIPVAAGTRELRVMLYWHDKEGAVASAKNLVNDLNLTVTSQQGQVYLPLVPDPTPNAAILNSSATARVDSINNAEQVVIDNPAPGNYTVSISGYQVPVGMQEYFIVYQTASDSVTVTYPNGGEGIVPAETELIRWDAVGYNGTFDVDYSDDGGTTWNNISAGVPGSERFIPWNVPFLSKDEMLVRVTRNGFSDVSDSMFTVIPVPSNFHVQFACPDSVGLAWNAVQNASGYEVSMLGNKYMDYAGTTTATSFTVTGTSPANDYWFSVKALGPHGGKGCRDDAIHQPAGVTDCSLAMDGELQLISPSGGLITDCQNLTGYAVHVNIFNPGQNPISNFNVSYLLDNNAAVTENYPGTILPGGSSGYFFNQVLNLSNGSHTLSAWISLGGDLNSYNDTSHSAFSIIGGAQGVTGVDETFTSFAACPTSSNCESTNCTLANGWINASNSSYDDIDWRVNSGPTPSASTGPSVDHTTGSGNYIYLEASSCFEKEAILLSPCYDLSTVLNPVLTFWYHMYGSTMGDLHVDVIANDGVHADLIPARSGDQGDMWQKDSVDLGMFAGQTVSIRFRGVSGPDAYSDMALDDIGIFSGSSDIDGLPDNSLRLFPNPSSGIFNYSVGNNLTYTIIITDMIGNVIFQNNIIGKGQINLSSFPPGIYAATLRGQNNDHLMKLINIR